MNKKAFKNLSLRGTKCRGNLGFTLIELLVVVLIIAVLASIALPKYMATRDKAHLSGLMAIGKNVNDALDRRSLFDDSDVNTALNLLDISLKDYQGNDCTTGGCRMTVSGNDYRMYPRLNVSGNIGSNYITFYPVADDLYLGRLDIHTQIYIDNTSATTTFRLFCYEVGGNGDPNEERCEKLGKSMGATCSGTNVTCIWD
jgi:prepilin-type N-terminal cleavage/methylation domain-containing protein